MSPHAGLAPSPRVTSSLLPVSKLAQQTLFPKSRRVDLQPKASASSHPSRELTFVGLVD